MLIREEVNKMSRILGMAMAVLMGGIISIVIWLAFTMLNLSMQNVGW